MNDLPRIVPLDTLPASPWKNGGGVTRELARAHQADGSDFAWRLSIADIERPGPFSTFDGYLRRLVLLDGTGLYLASPGQPTARLNLPGDQHVFDGADAVRAALCAGPCRVINIITAHHARCVWTIRLLRDASLHVAGAFVLLPAQGRWRAGRALDAKPGTALLRLDGFGPAGQGYRTAGDAGPHETARPEVLCSGFGLAILLQHHSSLPPQAKSPHSQGAIHDR